MAALARAHAIRFVSVLRPTADAQQVRVPAVGGGVAFLAPKASTRIELESQCPKGAVAVVVHANDCEPFAAIGVYLPPSSATRAHWRPELCAWVVATYRRLRARYRRVLVMGDVNARYGVPTASGRVSEDAVIPQYARSASNELRRWTAAIGVTPVHGRTADGFGRTTCRSPTGTGARTESDYVLADTLAHDISPLPTQSWDSVPGAHVHRLVAVDLSLLPLGAPRPELVAQCARRMRLHLPPYGADAWHAVAAAIDRGLAAARPALLQPDVPVDTAMQTLNGVLQRAATEHLTSPPASLTTAIHRSFRGANVSPAVAAALQQARHLRRAAQKAGVRAASDADRIAAANLHRQSRALQTAARATASADVDQWLDTRAADLERVRPRAPHALHAALRKLSPPDPLVYSDDDRIPDRDGVPAVESFTAHWRELLREQRPPPEAVSDEEWMRDVPAAAVDAAGVPALDAPATWEEVYHFLFPPSTRIAPWNCGRAACKLCVAYAADHAAWCANPEAPVPTCTPRLHTSVAGGPDGLPAELLSWARPNDTVDRRAYRIRVAEAVAAVLSAALRDGRVPASVAEVVITPIFKPAKAGQVVARDDPAAYRGISVCNLTAKLLGVLITARLSHWSAFHGLISPAQAGFQSGRAAEWHVLVLDQAVKARRRAGADTYVAFFDLEKAYDRVHGSAMRAVLTRMGVPPRLVALVAEWDAVRRARIRVNGELSEPFGVDAGRPQGAPTSPIEFNLFIESLLRGIARRFPGVQVLRIRVDALAYADDLATPAESRAQLQSIVAFVEEWCHKWNMRLNTGPGKSEAIRFAEGQTDAQAAAHPPLTLADGRLISFVPEYRYLGYVVRHDLGTGAMSTKLQGKLLDTYHRYFTRNAVVRGASALLQLQLYRTCVIGAVNYARSVGMLSAIVRRKIDSTINEAARHILHLPSGTATALVLTASRLLTAVGVGARERERLRLQLVHTPWRDGIAPRLLAELEAEPRTRASTSGPAANWAHVAAVARRREARLGATLPAAASYVDVARVASVYARQLSYLTLQRAVRRAAPSTPAVITLPPASHGSLQHIAALRFGFPATAATLGQRHATTPLSVGGPGCLGSPLALVERGRFQFHERAAGGRGTAPLALRGRPARRPPAGAVRSTLRQPSVHPVRCGRRDAVPPPVRVPARRDAPLPRHIRRVTASPRPRPVAPRDPNPAGAALGGAGDDGGTGRGAGRLHIAIARPQHAGRVLRRVLAASRHAVARVRGRPGATPRGRYAGSALRCARRAATPRPPHGGRVGAVVRGPAGGPCDTPASGTDVGPHTF